MQKYIVALKHDKGIVRISTTANDEQSAKEKVCAAENAPLSAVKSCKLVLPKIKTLDIVVLEWFDKVNGNSYFSGSITVNQGLPTAHTIWLPFQYGYGSHSKDMAFEALLKYGYDKAYKLKQKPIFWQFCEDNKIILRYTKHENCKRAELANAADMRKR